MTGMSGRDQGTEHDSDWRFALVRACKATRDRARDRFFDRARDVLVMRPAAAEARGRSSESMSQSLSCASLVLVGYGIE